MGQVVQRCPPADANDVAVLNDVIDIGGAALADVFFISSSSSMGALAMQTSRRP